MEAMTLRERAEQLWSQVMLFNRMGTDAQAKAAIESALREVVEEAWLEAAECLEHDVSIATDALADRYERKMRPMYASFLREKAAAIRRLKEKHGESQVR